MDGIADALRASRAPLVYVQSLMTRAGETHGYPASRYVAEIVRYGTRVPDAVLLQRGPISAELLSRYAAESAHPVERARTRCVRRSGAGSKRPICSPISLYVRHDPRRTAARAVGAVRALAPAAGQRRTA